VRFDSTLKTPCHAASSLCVNMVLSVKKDDSPLLILFLIPVINVVVRCYDALMFSFGVVCCLEDAPLILVDADTFMSLYSQMLSGSTIACGVLDIVNLFLPACQWNVRRRRFLCTGEVCMLCCRRICVLKF